MGSEGQGSSTRQSSKGGTASQARHARGTYDCLKKDEWGTVGGESEPHKLEFWVRNEARSRDEISAIVEDNDNASLLEIENQKGGKIERGGVEEKGGQSLATTNYHASLRR